MCFGRALPHAFLTEIRPNLFAVFYKDTLAGYVTKESDAIRSLCNYFDHLELCRSETRSLRRLRASFKNLPLDMIESYSEQRIRDFQDNDTRFPSLSKRIGKV